MTIAVPLRRPFAALERRVWTGLIFIALGLVDLIPFGLHAHHANATFFMYLPGGTHVPNLVVPAQATSIGFGAATILLGLVRAAVPFGRIMQRWFITAVLLLFVLSMLCWSDAGQVTNLVGLLQGTVQRAIPLVLGALAGCMCERSGVINVAIEGQLLLGAFAGAVVASAVGSLWLGLVMSAVAGGLLGAVLAVFAIRYLVDQVVLGVVLNVFASGFTGYLYDAALVPFQNTLNSPAVYSDVRIPLLASIPVVGPVLFDSTIFLYIAYGVLFAVQFGLFHTRWGLRTRAVGEHPEAADTVGIRVLGTRYRNVILGGMVAGVGGASLTIGSVGAFGKDISSGMGYIALAALIFGRWKPFGAVGAALLFAFADALQNSLSIMNSAIPSDVLLMFPYLATILAVAGLVGRVQAPRADGKPYVKA